VTISDRAVSGGFRHVDADPGAAALIAALDDQAALPAIQRLRAAAMELLRPRLGDRLLDVGCGAGEVVRTLAGGVRHSPNGAISAAKEEDQ
jgi:precorrin-6B methylase 2